MVKIKSKELLADFIKAKDGGFLIRAKNDDNGIVLVVRPSHNDIYWAEVCWVKGKTRGWGARYEVRVLGHNRLTSIKIYFNLSMCEEASYNGLLNLQKCLQSL